MERREEGKNKGSWVDLVCRWCGHSCSRTTSCLWFTPVQTHSRRITSLMKERQWYQTTTSQLSQAWGTNTHAHTVQNTLHNRTIKYRRLSQQRARRYLHQHYNDMDAGMCSSSKHTRTRVFGLNQSERLWCLWCVQLPPEGPVPGQMTRQKKVIWRERRGRSYCHGCLNTSQDREGEKKKGEERWLL